MADQKRVNPIQVQKYLGGLKYPATREDIVNRAKTKGADDTIMSALQNLPDQEYSRPTDVTKALGKAK
ncbi:MAG TPA: DUF2795 domain-containing protein [Anaerolineales bacterium]|nr:DUF2795 domain-containing protein [Anaerolineales bacterium]